VRSQDVKNAFLVVVGVLFVFPTFTFADVVYEQPIFTDVVGSGVINGFTLMKFGGDNNNFEALDGLDSIAMFGHASSSAVVNLYVTCRMSSTFGGSTCGEEWANGVNIQLVNGQSIGTSAGYIVMDTATSVPFRAHAVGNEAALYYYFFFMQVSANAMFYGTSTPNLCQLGCGTGADFYGNPYLVLNVQSDSIPELTNLGQFKQFTDEAIAEEETFIGNSVIFKGTVEDADSTQVRFEVEVKPANVPFDALSTYVTSLTDEGEIIIPGSEVELIEQPEQTPADGYLNAFHWRARAINDDENASEWQEFGTPGNTDFIAHYTLGLAASELATQLKDQSYLWGGKGWDFDIEKFVPPETIISGYRYRDNSLPGTTTGSGVDCSGLVGWSYNFSLNPEQGFDERLIAFQNANGQYWFNTDPLDEPAELAPGDLLFFDWGTFNEVTQLWNGVKDGIMDHVALYVGEQAGYDVVHAASKNLGIKSGVKDEMKTSTGFVGFRKLKSDAAIAMAAKGHSPIHLALTDPDGNTIDHNTVIPSDEEYRREAPGGLFYEIYGMDENGYPEPIIYSPLLKSGTYTIAVVPIEGALPDQTYSLEFTAGDKTIVLAKDAPLNEVPPTGYAVDVNMQEGTVTVVKTLDTIADTYVKSGTPNKNQGDEDILRVRAAGDNRVLVQFDVSSIPQEATILSAKLTLAIAQNKDNWGKNGREVGAHRMMKDWTELGATWNCGMDSNTSNSNDNDCNGSNWEMGKPKQPQLWPYLEVTAATTSIANGQTGLIELDVTGDVADFVSTGTDNHGWLIKKENEGQSGYVEFFSNETGSGPQLTVLYQ
jgi:cell wall-associated NlpC family hydrolase